MEVRGKIAGAFLSGRAGIDFVSSKLPAQNGVDRFGKEGQIQAGLGRNRSGRISQLVEL
jgi:hypothetical protein